MSGAFPEYRETQRFAPRVVLPIIFVLNVLGLSGGAALHFEVGLPLWAAIAFAAVMGSILLPLLFFRLVVEARDEGLVVAMRPLHRRVIPWGEIVEAKRVTYRLRAVGGWGVRMGRDGRMSYTADGDAGVELLLSSGERALIGSAKPEELLAAILKKKREER